MLSTSSTLLYRLCQSTHEAADWERFVDLYTPLLLAWTRRLGLNEHDSADLIQDLFAALVEHLPTFEYNPEKSFRAWLRTLLMNRWRNQVRRRQARQAGEGTLASLSVPDQPPEFEEVEYRQHLVSRALRLMQSEFPDATWKACWETVVHDRPAAEVAAELGISVNSVYLARSRVLRRLREQLHGLLD
jgi:RNA polymerase sigma-70 factor (ECF subfamily)